MKKTDLSIQLVNFNTAEYLMDCLKTISNNLKGSNLSFEINILDNNSSDKFFRDFANLERFISFLSEIGIRDKTSIYFSDKNLGYGGGHNLLAKKSHNAKFLLLLNTDILIQEPGAIEKLLCRIEKDKEIKVIGPQLYNLKGQTQLWDHGESRGVLAKILNELGLGVCLKRKKESISSWVSGAVFLIRKSTFDEIGGFDENFFLYKEEEDLCLRIRRQDRKSKILYYPEVSICHIGSVIAKKSKFFKKSYQYFLKKHKFGKRN